VDPTLIPSRPGISQRKPATDRSDEESEETIGGSENGWNERRRCGNSYFQESKSEKNLITATAELENHNGRVKFRFAASWAGI
jgi:hypothetical protein